MWELIINFSLGFFSRCHTTTCNFFPSFKKDVPKKIKSVHMTFWGYYLRFHCIECEDDSQSCDHMTLLVKPLAIFFQNVLHDTFSIQWMHLILVSISTYTYASLHNLELILKVTFEGYIWVLKLHFLEKLDGISIIASSSHGDSTPHFTTCPFHKYKIH